jgi:hypothetical protein
MIITAGEEDQRHPCGFIAFLSEPATVNQTFPLTLNADGTVNSETHPPPAGSVVTIFVDGQSCAHHRPGQHGSFGSAELIAGGHA